MGANVVELSDANFQAEVLNSPIPVLVDFWAPWCGPCRQIAPMIDQLATENLGNVKVAKVNVDECPQSSQSYDVSSIPTLILFKNGEPTQRFVGGQPKSRLQSALDELVS
jgi:thioredoxin 1